MRMHAASVPLIAASSVTTVRTWCASSRDPGLRRALREVAPLRPVAAACVPQHQLQVQRIGEPPLKQPVEECPRRIYGAVSQQPKQLRASHLRETLSIANLGVDAPALLGVRESLCIHFPRHRRHLLLAPLELKLRHERVVAPSRERDALTCSRHSSAGRRSRAESVPSGVESG